MKISLKFVLEGPIDNKPALGQIMALRQPGDKPFSGPIMVSFTDAYMRHSVSMRLQFYWFPFENRILVRWVSPQLYIYILYDMQYISNKETR